MMPAEVYRTIQKDLEGFGHNAVADVGKVLTLVQALGLPEKNVMPTVQFIYVRHYEVVHNCDANQARQSWVAASGNNFESFMRNFLNSRLNSEGILAVKGDRLRSLPAAANIVSFLTLRANRRCTQTTTGVWPDSDIVVLTQDNSGTLKTFALLNCKTSDHSRNDAVLFWALALRDNNIRYCLLTQDLDGRFNRGDNDPRISSFRRKAEAFLDRIYSTNPSTVECSQVKKLAFNSSSGANALLEDLRRWRQDVVPDYASHPLTEEALQTAN